MNTAHNLSKRYLELADWWTLLSLSEDGAEEASFYQRVLLSACSFAPRTLLKLGSGGGNNASHMKQRFQMTLVDLSFDMLKISQGMK